MWRRLTLRRVDGRVYLDRWGIGFKSLFSVYLHRIDAPDPGVDLHDHPWFFVSLVLRGGYIEQRAPIRHAVDMAYIAGAWPNVALPGVENYRDRWSVRTVRLDEAHRIVEVVRPTWTLVITGPVRRNWAFYTPAAVVLHTEYARSERGRAREMSVDNERG